MQGAKNKDDMSYWNRFVAQFFSPNGVFRHTLHVSDSEDTPDKQYDISYPAIARYFHTHFSSGVKSMQLILDSGSSDKHLPGDCYCIENPRASFVYWFETGSHVCHMLCLTMLCTSFANCILLPARGHWYVTGAIRCRTKD